jgi:hypothetical protein
METAHVPTCIFSAERSALGNRRLHDALRRARDLLISEDHWTSSLFADELRTIEDYGRLSARLRAAMGPHVVDILKQGLSVVLDFPANTVRSRDWMRSLISQAGAAHELHLLDVPGRDLQAEAARTKCGRPAPVPGKRSGVRSVHELFRPSGTRRGLQHRRSRLLNFANPPGR